MRIPFADRPMVVMGESMEPTLHSGQVAVLDTRYYQEHPIRRGDVIAFNRDGQVYVKRVLATGGDTLVMLHYIRETGETLCWIGSCPNSSA